ncbi:hypothetical protein B0T16DRAFT_405705 [Cercophora newfieldiana]|uniref:Uncharacterized protein n=1 Tax=Cercophora newfieldiana TaxID=92897 RepID=A0AA40CVJ7_9PEZI|nr:hypothetical protein B0T16DRAFT_405705 [Cercophora newfieldiana]
MSTVVLRMPLVLHCSQGESLLYHYFEELAGRLLLAKVLAAQPPLKVHGQGIAKAPAMKVKFAVASSSTPGTG